MRNKPDGSWLAGDCDRWRKDERPKESRLTPRPPKLDLRRGEGEEDIWPSSHLKHIYKM